MKGPKITLFRLFPSVHLGTLQWNATRTGVCRQLPGACLQLMSPNWVPGDMPSNRCLTARVYLSRNLAAKTWWTPSLSRFLVLTAKAFPNAFPLLRAPRVPTCMQRPLGLETGARYRLAFLGAFGRQPRRRLVSSYSLW